MGSPQRLMPERDRGLALDVRPPAEFRVEEAGRAAFLALEDEWNALVTRTGAEPFMRHAFIRIWCSSFAPAAELVILSARDAAGRLVAALPLMAKRALLCGLPVRQLTATANAHSCRFDMLAEDAASAARAFLAHLLDKPGWDVLRIIDVRERGNAWQIHRAARQAGLPVGTWESQRSPYIALPPTYAELEHGLRSKFKANLRRRRRQLEGLGAVSVERVTGGAQLEERLEEGFALERSGWKGERWTSIAQRDDTRAFYTELASSAAAGGQLSLFFLRLDGRPIAFHYGLTYGGTYYVPKLAYDEDLKAYGPGHILVEESVKDAISRGLAGWDFLGGDGDWKKEWTATARAHHWLFVFRDTGFGRTLRKAKFELVPAARQALSAMGRRRGQHAS